MFNSYTTSFGEPVGEISEHLEEIVCELANVFEYEDYEAEGVQNKNLEAFRNVLHEISPPLSLNDKAHILDGCFHFANENFYELEDDGIVDSSADCQNIFLVLIEEVLESY
jgi:hypothetical protein